MAVEAIYMGQGKDGVYLVNVRPANPKKGYLGGAGFIRRFETKDAAKEYAASVNKTGMDTFEAQNNTSQLVPQRHAGDVFQRA
ncbi:hypothetical protein IJ596_02280 [bacterium]|nr:hypothetical protein [bacterium]